MAANGGKSIVIILIIVIIAIGAYAFLNMPDQRTPTQKAGDAIHDLGQGPEKASQQLESRTPGQKLGDAVKDTGDSIKQSTAGSGN